MNPYCRLILRYFSHYILMVCNIDEVNYVAGQLFCIKNQSKKVSCSLRTARSA